jgi:hypothetical protein
MTAFRIELKNPSIGEHPLILVVFIEQLDAVQTPTPAEVTLRKQ